MNETCLDWTFAEILKTYQGSDGDRTKALYEALEQCDLIGHIAINLFRACKASERAKVYRGGNGRGRYRTQAYDKKSWSIDNLAKALAQHAPFDLVWGWGLDKTQPVHRNVLYIDLPTGQVSFHTAPRGVGPDYPGEWDGVRGMGPQRICQFCAQLLERAQ